LSHYEHVPSALAKRIESVKLEIDQRLEMSYPRLREVDSLEETYSAMRYMIFLGGGGKRFRPALTMEACRLFGGSDATAGKYAQGIEEIHTYTMILDDIQDKSDQRGHQETCHVRFGIDTALLAAMGLFERGVAPFHRLKGDDAQDCRRLLDLLHRGQAADLAAESWPVSKRSAAALNFIHSGKASALFQLSIFGGCSSG
jgi:geranylgeranyl pyrophosphate synthase